MLLFLLLQIISFLSVKHKLPIIVQDCQNVIFSIIIMFL